MERTKFVFHQFKSEFFKPLSKKYRFLTINASLIIGLAFYLGIDIVLAEVVRQNSYDMHMLAAEQLNELGPCFISESVRHSEMIKQYTKHLEQRHLAALVRVLFPKYSPKKLRREEKKKLRRQYGKQVWQAIRFTCLARDFFAAR